MPSARTDVGAYYPGMKERERRKKKEGTGPEEKVGHEPIMFIELKSSGRGRGV